MQPFDHRRVVANTHYASKVQFSVCTCVFCETKHTCVFPVYMCNLAVLLDVSHEGEGVEFCVKRILEMKHLLLNGWILFL